VRKAWRAAAIARAVDAQEKEVPWVTVESMTTLRKDLGGSFAVGLGLQMLKKAVGKHLDYESTELARRVTDNLPWGPGPDAVATMTAPEVEKTEEQVKQ